ncbi:hypothetical protein ACXZ1M_28925 [Duganella sp. PWIR1]
MSFNQRDRYELSIITTATILCLAGMAVSVLAYAVIRPEFISTQELAPVLLPTWLLMMSGLVHSYARKKIKELKAGLKKRNSNLIAGPIANFIIAGVIIWFITFEFFSGIMSYISHISLEKVDTVKTISVIRASVGHRRCGNNATLQLGENAIWTSRLCQISDSETQQLREGGLIRAYGVFTQYGMQITSFEVISAGQ